MDIFNDLSEWIQALSETENETVIFLLKTVWPVSITMFGFFVSGLLLAYLIWSPYLRRLNAAREDNLMLTGRLNEIIEDQNILLASLNEVHGAEQEKWHLKMATREDRLQSLNGRLAELDSDSNEIRAELLSRDEKIESLHNEVEEARHSHAEFASRLKLQENQIEGLKRDLSAGGALGKRVHELEGILEERDSELEKINDLILKSDREHESAIRQLRDLLRERDEQLEGFWNDQASSEKLRSRISELEEHLREHESELSVARKDSEKHNAEFRDKLAEQDKILAGRQQEIDSLRAELSDKGNLLQRIEELEQLLSARQDELEEARNHGNAAREEQESRIEELNQLLNSRDRELSALRVQLETIDQQKSRIAELENTLAAKSREIEELKTNQTLAEELQEKLQRLENTPEPADHTGELDQLRRELQQTRTELKQVNEDLEAALALIEEPHFAATVDSVPTNQFTVEDVTIEEPVRIGFDSDPLNEEDDLTLIKGVGKVMEQKLHEFGVYRFQQIGSWTDTVIEDFTDDLPFGNRVSRDNWVSQARELHLEKYGEAV